MSSMPLDEALCYEAIRSRDPRFDGRFFTAVMTTGIYCRPICPARTPRRGNVRFFACAAAAEAAGFRACRRCRPEAAPGTPAWAGASATVERAMRLLGEGALDDGSVEDLAEQLGVGGRYLRRLFDRHLGASPIEVAVSQRAHFARALLDQPQLSITEVAHASGFGSIRRFNETIRALFGGSPSELRARQGLAVRSRLPAGELALSLGFRPPLEWAALLDFLAARAIAGVEEVASGRYRRLLALGDRVGELEVSQGSGHTLALRVQGARAQDLLPIVRCVRRLFDLDADPAQIAAHLGRSPVLARSIERHPGLRVPGAWDGFELVVRAVLGQQVSVARASALVGALVRMAGRPVRPGAKLSHLFPTPRAVAQAELERLGLPRSRANALREVACAIASDPQLVAPGTDPRRAVARLRELAGIGAWTAEYVAMRALGDPDALPSGDLGLRRATGGTSAAELERTSSAWRPWRAYAVMHLWTFGNVEERHEDRARAI
jgi:AraC family transcriptional regulator of adaptative response / DNA-3-methyladenine glycosylase II